MKAHAIEHVRAGQTVWSEIDLNGPGPEEVLVRAQFSAISAGTESLLFTGRFPPDTQLDASIPELRRVFDYPVRYGYSLVGEIIRVGHASNEHWLGRRVFLFHPHQDLACVRLDACWPVPEGVSIRAGCFLPNTESAVNFVMDLRPVLGERLLVVGLGVVGLLTTAILMHFPLGDLVVVDRLSSRRAWGRRLGAKDLCSPRGLAADNDPAGNGIDAALELTGDMSTLNEVFDVMGFGGRIVVGSWYGEQHKPISLGGAFHRRRLSLVSSQVSTVAADLSSRWSKSRRMALARNWLARIDPEPWISHMFPPSRCQQAFELAAQPTESVLQILFDYR